MPDLGELDPVHWRQGEHVALLGMTGSGKSYLAVRLAQVRDWVIFIRTKPDTNRLPGFVRIRSIDGINRWRGGHWLLEPTHDRQRYEIARALDMAWREGGWTVFIDELWYVDRKLGLTEYVDRLTTQGRSKGITVVTGVQRPAWVSKFAFAESLHFFVFRLIGRTKSAIDIKAVRDMLGEEAALEVMGLDGHDFVYAQPSKGRLVRGNANLLDRLFRRA